MDRCAFCTPLSQGITATPSPGMDDGAARSIGYNEDGECDTGGRSGIAAGDNHYHRCSVVRLRHAREEETP